MVGTIIRVFMLRADDTGVFLPSRAIFFLVLLVLVIYAAFQWQTGCAGTSLILFGIVALLLGFQGGRVLGGRRVTNNEILGTLILAAGGYVFLFVTHC